MTPLLSEFLDIRRGGGGGLVSSEMKFFKIYFKKSLSHYQTIDWNREIIHYQNLKARVKLVECVSEQLFFIFHPSLFLILHLIFLIPFLFISIQFFSFFISFSLQSSFFYSHSSFSFLFFSIWFLSFFNFFQIPPFLDSSPLTIIYVLFFLIFPIFRFLHTQPNFSWIVFFRLHFWYPL